MEHLPQLSFFLCDNVGLCLCHQGNDYSEAVCVCVCLAFTARGMTILLKIASNGGRPPVTFHP